MQSRVVRRKRESGGGNAVRLVSRVMCETAQDGGERNLLIGIEPVIKADAGFVTMAGERLFAQVFSLADFPGTVGRPAASQADGQAPVPAQAVANAPRRVPLNPRH